ncbi:MAG TPA: MFS transporter [Candidatus Latescibacteria bacterium]|nr:MFS transporter [Candidatus Latescibacterota bacterium]HRS94994.1 MFS transporter [Candidatus Latescibacterota bacterium]
MRFRAARWRALPTAIWALGFGSLFMDISSELIHSLLPVFMVSSLGASMVVVGVVEGVAEATAAFVKLFSGALSDWFGRRKPLLVLGYALGAASKPVFPLAGSVAWVFAARFVDRVGKGIRGAPRDALVAEVAPANMRGAAYGLRQALDSVGSLAGPLLAVPLMVWFLGDIRSVLWVATFPAVVSVLVLIAYVREPERVEVRGAARPRLMFAGVGRLPGRYWIVVLLGAVFTLARFSEAFLVLRARDTGMPDGRVPLVLVVMNLFYAAGAYPAGSAADRINRRVLLLGGLALLVASNLVLAGATTPPTVLFGVALWGLHMALTQGLLAKLVSDATPGELLGTAFGVFHLVSGAMLLVASIVAGALWTTQGASATFLAGAAFAAIAAIGVWSVARRSAPEP